MRLQEYGLLKGRLPSTPRSVEDAIRRLLSESPSRRILVLLDEADNFLTADRNQDFVNTSRLKALMDDTERRFKVVFAGLHNVRRLSGLPHQPFAHLGTAVIVGPG